MTAGLDRALRAIAVIGLLAGIAVFATRIGSDVDDGGQLYAGAPLIGWSFIGTGLYAWARRPANGTGPLMVAVGFAWLAAALKGSDVPGLHVAGLAVYLLPYAILLHLLLAFPSGRLDRAGRWLAGIAYVVCLGLQLVMIPFNDPLQECRCNVPNPLLIVHANGFHDALMALQAVGSVVGLSVTAWYLWRRWRSAAPAQRHELTPVLSAAGVMGVCAVISFVADYVDIGSAQAVVDAIGRLGFAGVPFAFLIGLARSRFSRAVGLADLLPKLEARPPLREALAEALHDPTLRLAFRVGDGYVGADGRPVALPAHGGCTPVERDGRPVGALLHDPALAEDDPAALRAAAAAAGLALENERLEVELRARIEELSESRRRIVRAGMEERRRLERDLHDGAQQRLVALALTLRLARGRAGGELVELLDEAAAELQQATNELRELARGIHPAVLTDRGLGPALSALAGRSTVPVEVDAVPDERLPTGVESAAYFLVAEALTNVDRYAQATHASVSVQRVNGHVTVEVRDDGVGGADPSAGSGLRGLADRVSALDGRLDVDSRPGAGTTVRAVLPCGS